MPLHLIRCAVSTKDPGIVSAFVSLPDDSPNILAHGRMISWRRFALIEILSRLAYLHFIRLTQAVLPALVDY